MLGSAGRREFHGGAESEEMPHFEDRGLECIRVSLVPLVHPDEGDGATTVEFARRLKIALGSDVPVFRPFLRI
jgi:hypothetical protein